MPVLNPITKDYTMNPFINDPFRNTRPKYARHDYNSHNGFVKFSDNTYHTIKKFEDFTHCGKNIFNGVPISNTSRAKKNGIICKACRRAKKSEF